MCRVHVALGVFLGDVAQEALELGKRWELADVDERRRRHVLGDIGGAAVDRNAAREEAIEELLRDVAGEARVLVHQGEAVAGQEFELIFDRAAVRALGRRVERRLDGRMAVLPTLTIEVEVIVFGKGGNRPQPSTVAVARDRPIAEPRDLAPDRQLARAIQPARQLTAAWQCLVAVDHGQKTAMRPGPTCRSRRRARLREVQRVKPGRASNSVAGALEQKGMRKPSADFLQVVVEPPGDHGRFERDQHGRACSARDQALGIRRPVVGDHEDLAWIDAFCFDAISGQHAQAAFARGGMHREPGRGHRHQRSAHGSDRPRIEDTVGMELGVARGEGGVARDHLSSGS